MAGRKRDPELDSTILDAVREIVRANGARAASVAAVARRAGVPRSTIYRRWATWFALLDAALAPLLPMSTPSGGARARLLLLLRADVAFAQSSDGRALAHVLLDADERDRARSQSLQRVGQRRQQYADVLATLASPTTSRSALESAAAFAVDVVWGGVLVDRGKPDVERLANAILATLLGAR